MLNNCIDKCMHYKQWEMLSFYHTLQKTNSDNQLVRTDMVTFPKHPS